VATFDWKISLIPEETDDRAVFSGLVQPALLIATIEQMIADCRAHRFWSPLFGELRAHG